MIVKTVNGYAVQSQWDIEREIRNAPGTFVIGIQVDVQANIDRNFELCSPDNNIGIRRSLAFKDYDKPDNVGVRIKVKTGPFHLSFQGVDPNRKLGGNDVTRGGHIAKGGKYFPLGKSGLPCEACSRQLPSPNAFLHCLQGMCDWSPRLIGWSNEPPLLVVHDIHSWEDCRHLCCVNDR
eukprot:gene18885-25099_t